MAAPIPVQLIDNPTFEKETDTTTLHKAADEITLQTTELAANAAAANMDVQSEQQVLDMIDHNVANIPLQITSDDTEQAESQGAAETHELAEVAHANAEETPVIVYDTSISRPLVDVSDPIDINEEEHTIHVLSPVRDTPLDINTIAAPEGVPLHPVVQADLNFMQDWLSKAALNEEATFTDVVSKSQKKKKLNIPTVPPKTRSRGPPPPFK